MKPITIFDVEVTFVRLAGGRWNAIANGRWIAEGDMESVVNNATWAIAASQRFGGKPL
jgi:hypothetical protein